MSDPTNPNPPATPAPTPAPTGEQKPAPQQPQAPAGKSGPGDRGGPPDRPRFGGRGPKRRDPELKPRPEPEQVINPVPRLRDLDEGIDAELEAAMAGLTDKDLYGEQTPEAQKAQAAQAQGGRKKAKVISVHGPDVFLDIPGGRSQGVLPLLQFPDGPPAPGTEVEVEIEGYDRANGLLVLTRLGAAVQADWSTVAEGQIVEARVTETNKGGLSVDVNGIRGFLPISQIDLYRVENVDQFVNQRLLCMVTEVNKEDNNLVVSRRALLEKEREEQREKLWATLAEGQVHDGVVRSVKDFGAFVDIGGVDGLLHVSEMSWTRVKSAADVVKPGEKIRVVVLKIDPERRKVSLGAKQLLASPWEDIELKYIPGHVVPGKVTRLMDFGAFVELEPAVEGLIHVSELSPQRVRRVADVVQPDQAVSVLVLDVDKENRRISLSLKQALAQAEEAKAAEDGDEEAPEVVAPPRPRLTPLRGGIGDKAT